ncbi:MAG: sigma-70 family RNA polymerase sigma factor [Lachnospiraceae bacterium]|nr:sigma-70 family RNA polymerase sigma factor [Lachnospiraceae bacterium]
MKNILIYGQKGGDSIMQKGTESFSEIEDDDFENELLDALALERTAIQEIEQEKEENSFMEETITVPTSRKKLWRDTQKEALTRLEDSARTKEDFRNVQSWWDRLEANADRRYRYHVIGRSDIPLEWGVTPEEVILPEPIQSVFWKQITKGEFLDTIFDCPFEMHELVEDSDIARSIHELKDVHKEVLYYSAIRQYSNQRIACIRKQTDRNILKVKNTILKKLRKKLYFAICRRQEMMLPLCRREKEFLKNYSSVFADKGQTKPSKSNTTKGKQTQK